MELLKSRPIQCHKCWSLRHVRSKCRSNKDYTAQCFRCGEFGHTVNACKNRSNVRSVQKNVYQTNIVWDQKHVKQLRSFHRLARVWKPMWIVLPLRTVLAASTDVAHMDSSLIISSPETRGMADDIVRNSLKNTQGPFVRRTSEQMEIIEPK